MHARHPDGLWARAGNIVLSGWLVVSALAWDAGGPGRINALLVGYLAFVFSTVATLADGVRVLNTLLGSWLLASVWVLPSAPPLMRLNTALVGACLLVFSLISRRGAIGPPPVRALLHELEPPSARER
ncbi:MAG TPA: hypothetical protein VMU15_12855 [Anaeromyxobacter sp.]|nr:hypothetical protein [Anaeromyxobacter sp.]